MKTEYFRQLDALRAYAVFGVIFGHIPIVALDKKGFLSIFYSYLPGVPVFFCISGFLITLIILKNTNTDRPKQFLKSFYARRFLRIFPIYYLTITALYLANIQGYRDWFIYDLIYSSNIKLAFQGSFVGVPTAHFWSLAVEEQFYLIWPFLFILFRRLVHFWLILFFILLGFSFTMLMEDNFFTARTFTPLSYLSLGGLLAYFFLNKYSFFLKLDKYSIIVFSLFLAVIIGEYFTFFSVNYRLHVTISMVITSFVILRFVIGFTKKPIKSILENSVIIYLGKISYGLYLYHMFAIYPTMVILKLINVDLSDSPIIMQLIKIMMTIIIAILSWELLEKRLNRFKKYFSYT